MIEVYFSFYFIICFSLIIAGIIAINTNIEDTKNIIGSENRNLFAIASSSSSLLLVIEESEVLLEALIISVVGIIVLVFLKSMIISFTYSDGKILVIIKKETPTLNDLPT